MIGNLAPFFLVIFFSFLLANIDILWIAISEKTKKYLQFTILMVLTVFAGGRWYNVPFGEGIFDYAVYDYLYKNALNTTNFLYEYVNHENIHFRGMDIGYMFLNSVFSNYIFASSNMFFMLMSFVNMYFLFKSFKQQQITNVIFLVLFIYLTRIYFQYNYIMMRQSLAMAFVWAAMPLIEKKRFWTFFLVCILSATIHFTAIFFLFTYWLPRLKFSNKFILFTLPALFILGITKVGDKIIFGLAEKVLSSSLIGLDTRLTGYLLGDILGINLLNFIEILPFLYFAIKFREEMTATFNGKLFFNMLIFYIMFLTITMNFMIFTRVSSYYIYSYFFVLSVTYQNLKNRSSKVALGYAFVFYFTIYGVRFLMANFSYYGYNFFLFH